MNTTPSQETLLPCPFCGDVPTATGFISHKRGCYFYCDLSNLGVIELLDRIQWNTRHNLTPPLPDLTKGGDVQMKSDIEKRIEQDTLTSPEQPSEPSRGEDSCECPPNKWCHKCADSKFKKQSLPSDDLAKAIKHITSIIEHECLSCTWYEQDVLALNLVLTAAKQVQELRETLDAMTMTMQLSETGKYGRKEMAVRILELEQSSREKDLEIEELRNKLSNR